MLLILDQRCFEFEQLLISSLMNFFRDSFMRVPASRHAARVPILYYTFFCTFLRSLPFFQRTRSLTFFIPISHVRYIYDFKSQALEIYVVLQINDFYAACVNGEASQFENLKLTDIIKLKYNKIIKINI